MTERPRVRVAVERDHAVAAVGREGVAGEQAGARLADTALARDERDLPAAADGSLDARDELAMAKLGGARRDADVAGAQVKQCAAPAGVRSARGSPKHPLGREVVGRRLALVVTPGQAACGSVTVARRLDERGALGVGAERHGRLRLRPQGSIRDLAVFSGHDRLLSVDLLAIDDSR